jgi:small subunit ribosomal protein S6
MRKYEMTYLISDEVQESDLNKVTGKVAGFITELGGKVVKEDIWGRRKLAYPIKKQDFATYVTLYFDLPAHKTKEFDRDMRLAGSVLRHLLIVKDFGDEEITLTADEIADSEEIQEVIGGEKSFEAIEGETEESKDLMAVREASKEEEVEEAAAEPVVEETSEETAEEEAATEEIAAEEAKEPAEEVVAEEEPVKEEPKAEKEKPAKKEKKDANDEAERLSKLNEELDDILKDEL